MEVRAQRPHDSKNLLPRHFLGVQWGKDGAAGNADRPGLEGFAPTGMEKAARTGQEAEALAVPSGGGSRSRPRGSSLGVPGKQVELTASHCLTSGRWLRGSLCPFPARERGVKPCNVYSSVCKPCLSRILVSSFFKCFGQKIENKSAYYREPAKRAVCHVRSQHLPQDPEASVP